MISYDAIVQQIDKHVTQAKQQVSDTAMREQLAAIHALCELALQTPEAKVRQVVQVTPMTTPMQTPSTKLEEHDANGESLFDF